MKAGVSTACLYPELTETALYALAAGGIKTTEIFVNSPSELEEDYIRSLRGILDRYGMEVVSLHPFTSGIEPLMLFSDYERRYWDMLEFCRRYFHAMNLLGASIFVLHGDHRGSLCTDERYFERYAGLFRLGREYSVTVAQENVQRCRSSSPDFLQRMRSALGSEAAFVVDLKQAIRSGCDVYEVLDAVGDGLCNLHVSDSAPGKDCLPIGEGRFDFPKLAAYLAERGYKGALLVELYRENYPDVESLIESYRRLGEIIHKL